MKPELNSASSELSNIVLFDDVCRLCTYWVSFLRIHDRENVLRYVTVQSQEGQGLLAAHGYATDEFETLVYLDGQVVYDKSNAVIKILSDLGGVWLIASLMLLIPTSLRDHLYTELAHNRYRIFGKLSDCRCGPAKDSINTQHLSLGKSVEAER